MSLVHLKKTPDQIIRSYEIWARLVEEHGVSIFMKQERKNRLTLTPGEVVKELRILRKSLRSETESHFWGFWFDSFIYSQPYSIKFLRI